MYDIKCLGYPEGKSIFQKTKINIKNKTKLEKKSRKYWENNENIQFFLNNLTQKLNLKKPEDWKFITQKQIQKFGGSSLLKKYSLHEIKCLANPNHKNLFIKQKKTNGYWNSIDNIQKFLLDVKEKLNLESIHDWNSITLKQLKQLGGSSLIQNYSLYEIKCFACPEGKNEFSLPNKPIGYWEKQENIDDFLLLLREKLNLITAEDWNLITRKQIKLFGGSFLLKKYSMFELKCMAFPQGKSLFYSSKPLITSDGFWENKDNIQNFIDMLKLKYNLNSLDDWKRISKSQIYDNGGFALLSKKNEHLLDQFPEFSFLVPSNNFHFVGKTSQRWLCLQVQNLFPDDEIVEDYFHSEISRKTGLSVQFDVFVVKKNIAFEYHGKHHYEDIPSGFPPVEVYKNRDKEKEKLCEQFGIQLIVIPYWWDNSMEPLRKTVLDKISSFKM